MAKNCEHHFPEEGRRELSTAEREKIGLPFYQNAWVIEKICAYYGCGAREYTMRGFGEEEFLMKVVGAERTSERGVFIVNP